MSVVLDASAAIQLVLNGPHAGAIRVALEPETVIVAPDLYAAEVGNTLWKYVRAGHFDVRVATSSLADALELVTHLTPSRDIAAEALHESARLGHPVYDMLYLVTTRREAATLVTCDRRLRNLASSQGISVAGIET